MKKRRVEKNRTREEKAFQFLRLRAKSGKSFTVPQLARHCGWKEGTPQTYLTKHWADLVERVGPKRYRVKSEFTRLDLEAFLAHGSQVHQVYTEYRRRLHHHLVVYEFLLPLTREDQLRQALDDLFYADTLRRRLQEIGVGQLTQFFPRRTTRETDRRYIGRLVDFAQKKITGYSISHVSGRFRAGDLIDRQHAGKLLAQNKPYLIDETTAVVRFVIPCATDCHRYDPEPDAIMEAIDSAPSETPAVRNREIRQTRHLFYHLFAEAVARTVGEQEVWLLERSPLGERLYVWARE